MEQSPPPPQPPHTAPNTTTQTTTAGGEEDEQLGMGSALPSSAPAGGGNGGGGVGGNEGTSTEMLFSSFAPPTTTKDWRAKHFAVGNLGRFPRHHMGLLGSGHGSARCFPQPVFGATMGHGLSTATDTFFFPELEGVGGGPQLDPQQQQQQQQQRLSTARSTTSMGGMGSRGASRRGFLMSTQSEKGFGQMLERERREVISQIRSLDVRRTLRSGGGRLQSREKGRNLFQFMGR